MNLVNESLFINNQTKKSSKINKQNVLVEPATLKDEMLVWSNVINKWNTYRVGYLNEV